MVRGSQGEALGRRDVHVWWFDLNEAREAVPTRDELEHAARFADAEDGRRFLAGRACLRETCAQYVAPSVPAHDLVTYQPSGRPDVSDPELQCSMSHSGEIVAVAIARRPVGIDVEAPRSVVPDEALLSRWTTAAQRRRLTRRALNEREELFLCYWVAREAIGKARGVGLHAGRRPHVGWHAKRLQAPRGYPAAVAAQGWGWRVTTMRWA